MAPAVGEHPRPGRKGPHALGGSALDGACKLAGPPDLVHPAEALENPDQPRRRIDHAPQCAMARPAGVRVVDIVPALTKRQDCQGPNICASVVGLERPAAEDVTDRVDAPGDM